MPSRRTKSPKEPPASKESNSDDSSIASDDAFDSEDERRYGGFFEERRLAKPEDHDGQAPESDDEESKDDDTADEEDQEGSDCDDGNYMLSLLAKLEANEVPSRNRPEPGIAAHTKESEFAAAVVKGENLTLDSLMGSIQDTASFARAQKQLKKVAQGEATPVPMARVASDRMKRKLLYEEQSKDVSQWIDAVQQNRRAETLDFRPKQRLEVTQQGLVDSFTPTTEFEKQIHAALQKAGQEDDETILKRERERLQDDLGANEITLEEYKRRHGELAKMRALMFYHEQKRHHINKIKSKKYRRIRKRQRERYEEALLADDPEQLQEKEETERILERASLAHKNTSRWAKRVLKRGNKVDINTRKALSESVRKGDDLLKRMKNTRHGGESSDSEDEDLVASAKAVLADTEDGADTASDKHQGLFQLSFMQKGIEKQKARAREEARQLLRELVADEDDQSVHEDEPGNAPVPAKKIGTASKEEMKTLLGESEFVVASLKLGQQNQVMVNGSIDVDLHGNAVATGRIMNKASGYHSEHCVTVEHPKATHDKTSRKDFQSYRPFAKQQRKKDSEGAWDESNPWLSGPESTQAENKSIQNDNLARGNVDIEKAGSLLDCTPPQQPHPPMNAGALSEPSGKISGLTQDELVRRAFASVARSEGEAFADEKLRVAEDEDVKTKQLVKESKMAGAKGWGLWAGMGAPTPNPLRKYPQKLQPHSLKLGKRTRVDDKKPNVILSEKRIKRLAKNYMLSAVPYPFTSREEYEKAMSGSLGKDFNVTSAFESMTRSAVLTRPGKVIQPLSLKLKVRRSTAKF